MGYLRRDARHPRAIHAIRPHDGRLALFAVAALAVGCRTAHGTSASEQGSQHWDLVRGWPALAAGVHLGQVSGVDVDTLGHVMVFHRAGGTFDREATKPRPTATVFEAEVGDNSKSRMASRSMPRGM